MSNQSHSNPWRRIPSIILKHFWFKCFGTTGFIAVFFAAYIYLLKNPAYPVTEIPAIWLDDIITLQPAALPFYLSLWLFVSLPPMLMTSRLAIIEFGIWIGAMCLAGLAIFYFWPSAVSPVVTNWDQHPGMAFLKGIDAAGNACPSLHVATALFSCLWLFRMIPALKLGRAPLFVISTWCTAIVYSTMATKQHMALDVIAGIILSLAFFLPYAWVKRKQDNIVVGDHKI